MAEIKNWNMSLFITMRTNGKINSLLVFDNIELDRSFRYDLLKFNFFGIRVINFNRIIEHFIK